MDKTNVSHKHFLLPLILLTSFGVSLAQNLPDAPSVAVSTFPAATGSSLSGPNSSSYQGAAPSAKAPFIDLQIADSAYWDYTAALTGSTILNVEMTARCSERGTCLTWIAAGSAEGSTRLRLYAYTLPADAAISWLTYKLKRKTRLWILPPALVTAANLFSAGRSYGRLQLQPVSTNH